MAWNFTVPDNYVESHIVDTATETGTAAIQAAVNIISKYDELTSTHTIFSVVIETGDHLPVELVQEIGRQAKLIIGIFLITIFQACSFVLMGEYFKNKKYNNNNIN